MKVYLTSQACQKLWWSRWLQWCYSCLEGWLIANTEKWKCGRFQATCLLKMKNIKKMPKASSKSWKWGLVEANMLKDDLFPSRSLDVSQSLYVVRNILDSGPMQPNSWNWCPATTLGTLFWAWFDLWRLPRETVSKACSLLKVILLFTINLSTLTGYHKKYKKCLLEY